MEHHEEQFELGGMFPPEQWGDVFFGGTHPAAPVHMRIRKAPDGLVAVAVCMKCGGRNEAILSPLGGIPATVEVINSMHAWGLEHAECETEPREYVMPEALKDYADTVIGLALKELGDGEMPLNAIHVLTTDGTAMVLPVAQIPSSSEGPQRRLTLHAMHAFVRSKQLDILGVVSIAEAWMAVADTDENGNPVMDRSPSEMPNRQEIVLVTAMTPTFGMMAMSPITRDGGVEGEGPGRIGELKFEPATAESNMLDGLMAVGERPCPKPEWERDEQLYGDHDPFAGF